MCICTLDDESEILFWHYRAHHDVFQWKEMSAEKWLYIINSYMNSP